MQVLCFHHITPSPASEFDVTPGQLRDIVRLLREKGTRIVPPSSAPTHRAAEIGAPADRQEDEVAILFDDGYASTLGFALPLMEELEAVFGMAVVPGLLQETERPSYLPHSSVEFTTAEGVRRWLDSGGELIGHSFSHVKMTALATSSVRFELERELEAYEALNLPVPNQFAYPFGASDPRVRREVAAHYTSAFATGGGDGSAFDLHRITFRQWKVPKLMALDWAFLARPEND
ncbi:polysaccharide deacetylase family protein [Streptomyces sp. PTY087I2]|uniref:polysaccharide deacetylase family protein n=1 Tax=Streptomyces sp. PTY087I2 TaxID=1819298 RepID=UPI00080BB3CB|nr:polysaccharide deacetylase family protein [Streptomyces sp. PTY087I2]OCC10572.1 Polysaccharide deacetylase [Streptomyces sp. PTY087I2]